MTKCVFCTRRIFPWHRQGWLVQLGGASVRWHSVCKGTAV